MRHFLLVFSRSLLLCLLCFGLAFPLAAQQADLDDILWAIQYLGAEINEFNASVNQFRRDFYAPGTIVNVVPGMDNRLEAIQHALYDSPYTSIFGTSRLDQVKSQLDLISSSLSYNHQGNELTAAELLYWIWYTNDESFGAIYDELNLFRYQYRQDQDRITWHENSVENFLDTINGYLATLENEAYMIRASLSPGYFGTIAEDVSFLVQAQDKVMFQGDTMITEPYAGDIPPDLVGEPPDYEDVAEPPPDEPDIDVIAALSGETVEALEEAATEAEQTEEAYAEAAEAALEALGDAGSFNSVYVVDYDLPSLPGLGKPVKLHLSLDFAGKDFESIRNVCSSFFHLIWLAMYIFASWNYVKSELHGMIAN
ncbi:MAG: hypothetical protein QXT77_06680 [Candidatus Methanomethylicaceae archaeon]